jgi:hypothetical protein
MPVFIGFLIDGIIWMFRTRLGFFIASAMVWLGVSWGTTKLVVTPVVSALESYMAPGGIGASPIGAACVSWLGVLCFDKAITMICSAYVAKQSATAARLFLVKAAGGAH